MQKKFKRPMVILLIIQFLVMVGFGIVIPILPFFVDKLGGGALSLGIFMSAYSIMQFFFAPFWGRMSDRMGRRPVILIGLAGYGLTFLMFGMVNNLYLLIGIRAVAGMISSATLPTAMAYLADITEGADRSKGMGMIGAAMGLGMIFGPALGGWLGHYSFSLPFFVAGGLALLLLPFTWLFLPESLKQPTSAVSKRHRPRLTLDVVKNPLFALFAFNFALNFTMSMFESTFALLSAAEVGFGPKDMGYTFAIIGIFGVFVQGFLIGKLVKKFGDASLVKFGAVLCSIGFLLIIVTASASNAVLLVSSTVVYMVGNSLMTPTSSSLVTKQSTGGQGASLGLFQAFASLGRIIGPVTGGALFVIGMRFPYIAGAVLMLLIVLVAGNKISPNPKTLVQE
ncbi:Multidrug-efflux transporter [Desulfosporosinus sp. I2]|uniref:MFS transporter n=1 Tax=Desulfosporosinus sp. I2 TaxID=1617025 RepID=UPI0005EF6497|nr:tetracycline resistance MFS efflux pump [Desulfosporosinus sp. I2]KJR45848.1 Multidrug-efflux transporter [Desulfosporosinus sp. I2]